MHIIANYDIDAEIKRLLAYLVTYVAIDNHQGLNDVNVYSEDFLIPILNPLFGCKLVNMNTFDDHSYPGIDLGDENEKIAVQVTSTTVRKKIDHTIKQFEKRGDDEKFNSLYVVALSIDRPQYKTFTTNGKYTFSSKNVLSINELAAKIVLLPKDKKEEILESLKGQLNIPNNPLESLSLESFLINKFFKEIVAIAKEESDTNDGLIAPSAGDIDIKRERFSQYWSYIEECYRSVIQLQQERLFKRAFEKLDTSEQASLQAFLQRESEKALIRTNSPIEALDIVRKDIMTRVSLTLLSETQVENYLYYQLYMCKLLPNPIEVQYA